MELSLRKSYRGQLTKLVNSVNNVLTDENVNLDDVAVLIQRIQTMNLTLKDLNKQLSSSFNEDQYESECEKIVEYDLAATEAIARLERKLTTETQFRGKLQQETDEACNESLSNMGNNQNNMQNTSVRLPKLDIIKFNGEIALWPEFWEQYCAAIHDNKSLDNTAKFAYLKSYLVGKAALSISGLTSGKSSYEDAIDLLKAEYASAERIIDKYVQKLFTISHIKNERDTVGLRKLFTIVSTITKSLTTLGISADQYGLLVKSIVVQALPYGMRVAYNKQKISDSNDNASVSGLSKASEVSGDMNYEKQINGLLQFIKVELDSIEQASSDFDTRDNGNRRFNRSWNKGQNNESFTAAGLFTGAKECCLFCHSKSHVTIDCDSSLSVAAKKDILKKNRLCFRCAKPNHNSKFCKTKNICCAKCKRRHATTMCEPQIFNTLNTSSDPKSGVANAQNKINSSSSALLTNGFVNNIYLKTACAFVLSKNSNEEALIRMIIDGGSQLTFIREDMSRSMALPVIGTHKIAIQTFGQNEMAPARLCNRVKLTLKSQYDDSVVEISAVEVPEICFGTLQPPSEGNPIIRQFSIKNRLADFVVGPQQPISGFSLLIGADNYWQVVSNEIAKLTNSLTAVNTKFGWTIHGASNTNDNDKNDYIVNFNASIVLNAQVTFFDQTEMNLKKFWDLETIGINASETTAENNFTNDFIKNNVTFENERYQVTLPWQNDKILDSNFSSALVRAKRLAHKLCNNGTLTEYDNAIRDYIRSGCAEEVPDNEKKAIELAYYMPHRPVYRNDKETTKLRVVFDASAHAPGTPSLNEKLLPGENLLPNLMKILINFRIGAVAVIADIEKAFLQIGLSKEDRDFHRFLWFKEAVNDNITSTTELPDFTTFRMARVTFGVTTSPFLLAATLRKHLMESPERETAITLLKSFYVDDLVLAVESTAEALELYENAKSILSKANMNLRKWCSNDPTMMTRFNEDGQELPLKMTVNLQKVLGVIWRPITDELAINLNTILDTESYNVITKRNVLQTIAKIFDPIGILGPYIVKAKIILQNIWKRNIGWDDTLPDDLKKEWIKWREGLRLLNDYSIDRCLVEKPTEKVELHIFADASPQAYGCVAYLKILTTGDCKFITSKNRVSPINEQKEKSLTLPKLELTAALCAARLHKYLIENLSLNVTNVILWSDSKIALYWIKGKSTKWKPYVQNRVFEIRNLQSDATWRHCPGKDNPADLLTRGVSSANYLMESRDWLEGPPWLKLEHNNWPDEEFSNDKDIDALTCFIEVQEESKLKVNPMFCFDRYSDLDKILRITAYARRFLNNIDKQKEKITGPLTVSEICKAETYWIRVIQHEVFSKEIGELIKERPLPSQSTIILLRPFLDENNILRLSGRLQESCLSQEEKHPVILPKGSSLTTRIIWKAHEATFHSGVNSTLAEIRKRFWIIKGRQQIKSIISRCVKCKRLRGKTRQSTFRTIA